MLVRGVGSSFVLANASKNANNTLINEIKSLMPRRSCPRVQLGGRLLQSISSGHRTHTRSDL